MKPLSSLNYECNATSLKGRPQLAADMVILLSAAPVLLSRPSGGWAAWQLGLVLAVSHLSARDFATHWQCKQQHLPTPSSAAKAHWQSACIRD